MGKKKGGDKKGDKKDEKKPEKVKVDKTFGMKNKKGASAQKQIFHKGLDNDKKEDAKKRERSSADKKKLKEAKEAEARFLATFGYKAPSKPKRKGPAPKEGEPGFVNPDGSVVPEPPKEGEPGWVYEDGSIEPEIDPLLLEAGVKSDGTLKISDKPDEYAHLTRPPTPPEEEEEIIVLSLEELIEIARAEIVADAAAEDRELTPVNEANFKAWKKRKIQEKRAALKKEMKRQSESLKAGSQLGVSGKDLFKSGHAKSTDVGRALRENAEAGGSDSDESDPEEGGEFDITELRKAEAAEKAAAAGEDAVDDVAAAADAAAVAIDESLFADMDLDDLSDLDDDDLDGSDDEDDEDPLAKLVAKADARATKAKEAALEVAKVKAAEQAKVREAKLAVAKEKADAEAKIAAEEKAKKDAEDAEALAKAEAEAAEAEKKRSEVAAARAADPTLGMSIKDQIAAGLLAEANPGEATLFAKKETKEEKKARMAIKKAAMKAKKAAAAAAEAAGAD